MLPLSPPGNGNSLNTTEEVRESDRVSRHLHQAQAPDLPALSAVEFRSSQTVTSGPLPIRQEAEAMCACRGEPPRLPQPPPIPPEILQRMFSGENITQDLLSRKGFCRHVKEELKLWLKSESSQQVREEHGDWSEEGGLLQPSWEDMEQNRPPLGTDVGQSAVTEPSPRTKRVKVIDLMKNWRSLADAQSPPSPSPRAKGDNQADKHDREIIRQFSMELSSSGHTVTGTCLLTPAAALLLTFVAVYL